MTWFWSDDGGDGPQEQVVVEFTPDGDATTVVITHTGPWSTPEPAANYEQGWNDVLAALAAVAS